MATMAVTDNDLRGDAAPRQDGVARISLEGLRRKIERHEDFLLVMAMDQRRFEKAHIAGSVSFDTLVTMLPTLSRDTEIVVYCTDAACVASKLRAAHLVSDGFTNVRRFAGGLSAWADAGLAIVKPHLR